MGCCQSSAIEVGDGNTPSGVTLTAKLQKELPPGAEQYQCQHVYDGDTLTLSDGTRVRLLGIDAPELKPPQPFGIESRDFVKGLCAGKAVWLEYGTERKDRYDRTLAYVYVISGNTMCMVNEEVLRHGLGKYYSPGKAPLVHGTRLLAVQAQAKQSKLGVWKEFANTKKVLVTPHGKAYHRSSCKYLSESRFLKTMDEESAINQGLSACRQCEP